MEKYIFIIYKRYVCIIFIILNLIYYLGFIYIRVFYKFVCILYFRIFSNIYLMYKI